MRNLIFLIMNWLILSLWITPIEANPFKTGDFIFVDLDCGPVCDAIEDVTLQQFGKENPRLSHVGIIEKVGNDFFVWEAWPEGGVVSTPLKKFLSRKNSKNYWAPLAPHFRTDAEKALEFMRSKKNLPYNFSFFENSESYYCSQLIQAAFPKYFSLLPMYFGLPSDKNYTAWTSYFKQFGISAPQGQLGISPLGVFRMGIEAQLFESPDLIFLKAES